MNVLELFAGTCSFSKEAKLKGHNTFTVELNPEFKTDYIGSVLDLKREDIPFIPDLIWASPPCQAFSVAAIGKNWTKYPDGTIESKNPRAELGMQLAKRTLEIISWYPDAYYFIENPRGMLRKMPFMLGLPIRNTVTYCFSWETRVLTKNGTFNLKELNGTNPELLDGNGNWVESSIRNFGKQSLMKITLSRAGAKKIIFATDNHLWFVKNNKNPIKTIDLRKNHRLESIFSKCTKLELINRDVARGFTYGDGYTVKSKPKLRKICAWAQFCGDKDRQMIRFFDGFVGKRTRDDKGDLRITKIRKVPLEWKLQKPSLDSNLNVLFSWLAGYIAADGSVGKTGQVSLSSANKENLEYVRDLCNLIGIGTYSINKHLRFGYGKIKTYLYQITFMRSDILESLIIMKEHKRRFVQNLKIKHQPRRWSIISVEATDRYEDVYCATVPTTNSFCLEDNILTHNCQYGETRMKPTDIFNNCAQWNPRPACKNGDSCHEAAPRGSMTGTQGIKGARDRAIIPPQLCNEILEVFQ